jgi:hypothetical protein
VKRLAWIGACALLGCVAQPEDRLPALAPSAAPNVTCDGRAFLASWIEGRGEAQRLVAVRGAPNGWNDPFVVAQGPALLANWADFPSLLVLADGTLAAHWLETVPGSTFAYGVRVATSSDGGRRFGAPFQPHADVPTAEFGFVSLVADDGLTVLWLDGRAVDEEGSGTMSLRSRTWRAGAWSDERVIDPDVCSCCQTSAVALRGTTLVAYRDHTGTLRDITIAEITTDGTVRFGAFPQDGWEIGGCPVNGPALAASEAAVAVAWYTEARGVPRVLLALSRDGGRTFGSARRVDDGAALGRVDVAILEDGRIVVSWLEGQAQGRADVRARIFDAAAARELASRFLGRTTGARSSGFPRLAACGSRVGVVWTSVENGSEARFSLVE